AAHPVTYTGSGGNIVPPANSVPQIILPSIDPTVVSIFRTTAADVTVTGRVITAGGSAISRAQITVVDAATSDAKVGMTNLFGYFNVAGLQVGKLYIISVSHPSYQFTQSSQSFVLNDNISGLVFVASTGGKGTTPTGPVKTTLPSTPAPAPDPTEGTTPSVPVGKGKLLLPKSSPF
ncbi:MAG: carboxypeptidase-like regulatory domain-containing protein, partial [Pyrinomonadaceae bacterium]